jgi:hypothetical protein
MALLFVFALRLLPIGAILLLRKGAVSGWLLVIAIAVTLVMVVVNMYADYLRGLYLANEYNRTVADPIGARLNRFVPLRLATWLAYVIALILLLVVQS